VLPKPNSRKRPCWEMPTNSALLCVSARFLRDLGDHGIDGNGHMMMLEKNSDVLAGQVLSWIEKS